MDRWPASTWRRLFANILDSAILLLFVGIIIFLVTGDYPTELGNTWTWQILYTLYLTITPVLWSGYVIGKRIFKIKIKRYEDDGNVKLSNMFLREVVGFRLLGTITFGLSLIVSFFMIVFRKDKRGIHDFIGGTYVSQE